MSSKKCINVKLLGTVLFKKSKTKPPRFPRLSTSSTGWGVKRLPCSPMSESNEPTWAKMKTGKRGERGKGVSFGTPQANFQKIVLSNVVPLLEIFPQNQGPPTHFGKTLSYLPLDFPPCEHLRLNMSQRSFQMRKKTWNNLTLTPNF